MLHIIFFILKILGIIVLTIVAAVLLLLAALILLPLKYTAAASWNGSADSVRCRIKFHWLVHLIAGETVYENGTLSWRFRAAWKKFDDGGSDTADSISRRTKPGSDTAGPHPGKSQEKYTSRETTETKAEKSASGSGEVKGSISESSPTHPENMSKETPDKNTNNRENDRKNRFKNKKPENSRGKKSLYEKICSRLEKIKYTFHKLCDTIKSLSKKKDKIKLFFTDEIHKKAFSHTLGEARRLIRSLRPEKLKADIEFGFRDPSHTGYVLAGLGIIYPLIGEYTDIRPDFEHEVLNGTVTASGKIRLLYFVIPAWNLFFDRNVRATYRHIRKFRL